jgi:hypothetical protein
VEDHERERLTGFLDEFAELIDYVLARPPHGPPGGEHAHWFPPSTLESMRAAWTALRPEIDKVKAHIASREYDTRLEEQGFTGDQLDAKMAAWDSTRGPRWWQVWLGWLRPLQGALKIADGILESIGRAVPGVGVIEEFKKILEGLLDVGDGRGPIKRAASWLGRPFRRGPT